MNKNLPFILAIGGYAAFAMGLDYYLLDAPVRDIVSGMIDIMLAGTLGAQYAPRLQEEK